jgi:hypothetical protein
MVPHLTTALSGPLLDLEKLLNETEIDYEIGVDSNGKEIQKLRRSTLSGSPSTREFNAKLDLDKDELARLKKKYPGIITSHYKNNYVRLEGLNDLYNQTYKEVTGEDYSLFDKDKDGVLIKNKNLAVDINKFSGKNISNAVKNFFQDGNDSGDVFVGTLTQVPSSRNIKPKLKPLLEDIILPEDRY